MATVPTSNTQSNPDKMNFLVYSDVASTIAGMMFHSAFSSPRGSVGMAGVRAGVISIVARMISQNKSLGERFTSINAHQKNQLVVIILGMVDSMLRKKDGLLRGGLSASAVDSLGDEIVRLLRQTDDVIF